MHHLLGGGGGAGRDPQGFQGGGGGGGGGGVDGSTWFSTGISRWQQSLKGKITVT